MRARLLGIALVLVCAGSLQAGLSLGRPAAVSKRVGKLDSKVQSYSAAPHTNRAPLISSFVALSTTIAVNAAVSFTATASDPDGDTLTYVWSSTAGTISGSGPSVSWTAPSSSGVYSVACVVSDVIGIQVSTSIAVSVEDAGTLRWKFNTGEAFMASPAISPGGSIYAASAAGKLYSLSPSDGSLKWTFRTDSVRSASPAMSINSTPAVGDDGTIYFGDDDGYVYAVASDGTGKAGWPVKIGSSVQSSPAVGADGTIYVGSDDSGLYAFNPDGTQKAWSPFVANDSINSSPAIGQGGILYFGDNSGYVYAVDPAAGTQSSWSPFLASDAVYASISVDSDGTVYAASNDFNVYAINPSDGSTKWAFSATNSVNSSPSVSSSVIYFGDEDGYLNAVNRTSGVQSAGWPISIGSSIQSSPAIAADGTIYIGSDDNNLYAINPADASARWTFSASAPIISSPAIGADGGVYFGDNSGNFYAVNGSSALGSTAWPKYRGNSSNTGR